MGTDTVDAIRARLAAAQARERAARATAARLQRDLVGADRRRETQRLCLLGRALESWCERDERVRVAALRYVATYVNRDTDRVALAGTAWVMPDSVPAPGASDE